jgi:hypothetical protein
VVIAIGSNQDHYPTHHHFPSSNEPVPQVAVVCVYYPRGCLYLHHGTAERWQAAAVATASAKTVESPVWVAVVLTFQVKASVDVLATAVASLRPYALGFLLKVAVVL